MYEDRDQRREAIVGNIRLAKDDESWASAMIKLAQYDMEAQKVWSSATAKYAYLELTDILVSYFEKKSPRHPWKN